MGSLLLALIILLSSINVGFTASAVVVEGDVEAIVADPITMIEGFNGYDNGTYRYYDWVNSLTYTAVMSDGTELEGSGDCFVYDGEEYALSYTDTQSDKAPWTAGNTYTETVTLLGVSAQVSVTIAESPVVSVTVAPITLYENYHGSVKTETDSETGETREYICYDEWISELSWTATLADGTTLRGTSNYWYDGQYRDVQASDSQSYKTPWTVGNMYTGTFTVLGKTVPVDIAICSTPIVALDVRPITLTEGLNGEIKTDSNGESYFHYDWENVISYEVTLGNDDVYVRSGSECRLYGKYYPLKCTDTQSSTTPWTVGEYTVTVNLLGTTVEVPVTVKENPYAYLEITPEEVHLFENTGGRQYGSYYDYNWESGLTITAVYKDGHKEDLRYYRYFSCVDDQSYETPWTVGNTYYGTVYARGMSVQVPVTIEESPVASLDIEPITLAENTGGYTRTWGGTEYYVYDISDGLRYTVTLKDGTVLRGKGTDFTMGDRRYTAEYRIDTGYYNRWLAGNTYEVEVTLLGVTATAYVSVLPKTSADGFSYVLQDDKAILYGCENDAASFEIPSTVDGYEVVGLAGTWSAVNSAQTVTIPDSVEKISPYFFRNNTVLRELHIGSGLAALSMDMFTTAASLHTVTVSADNPYYCSVDGVVYDKALTELIVYPPARSETVVLPETVTNADCLLKNMKMYAGKSIVLHDNVKGYKQVDGVLCNEDMTVVYGCDGTRTGTCVLPDSVTTIAPYAFMNSNYDKVVLSNNVAQIVYRSFYHSNLKEIELPASLREIDYAAFEGCENLTQIDFPEGLIEIETRAFADSGLTSVTIPASVKELGGGAFAGAALETIAFCEGADIKFGGSVFANCTALTTFAMPDTATTIPSYMFSGTGITSVVIPKHITAVNGGAFSGAAVDKLSFEGENVAVDLSAFSGCPLTQADFSGTNVYADGGFVSSVPAAFSLPDTTTVIGYRAFENCIDLTQINIPASVERIRGFAFGGCTSLKRVDITDLSAWCDISFDTTHANPLCNSASLYLSGEEIKDLTIPAGVVSIGRNTFYGCTSVKSVTIPAEVTHIGGSAFGGCQNLTDVYYSGSESEWAQITIDYGNDPLTNATIHYSADNTTTTTTSATSTTLTTTTALCEAIIGYKIETEERTAMAAGETVDISVYISATERLAGVGLSIGYNADALEVVATEERGWFATAGISTVDIGTSGEMRFSVTEITDETVGENMEIAVVTLKALVDITANEGLRAMTMDVVLAQPSAGIVAGVCEDGGIRIVDEVTTANTAATSTTTTTASVGTTTTTTLTAATTVVTETTSEAITTTTTSAVTTTTSTTTSATTTASMTETTQTTTTVPTVTSTTESATTTTSTTTTVGTTTTNTTASMTATTATTVGGNQIGITITNSETGVVVSAESGVIEEDCELSVYKIVEDETGVQYSIVLVKDGKAVQPQGQITISIPVPGNLDGAMCDVYRVQTNGEAPMSAVLLGGKLMFVTDRCGVYTVKERLSDIVKGDLNGDGKVAIVDAVQLYYYVNGKTPLGDESSADMNDDGKINISDAVKLYYFVNGKIAEL